MKILYFDCFSGISGDMIIGALIDLGLEMEFLENELKKLNLKNYEINAKKVLKEGVSAIKFNVIDKKHDHEERNLEEINSIIDNSSFDPGIKEKIKKIFFRIAEAESKIHQVSIEKIHFHEIGAIDTIVDIAGAVIGFKKLGIGKIFCSRLNTGTGFVEFSHGKWPVPAPATAEILKNVPIYHNNIEAELVTPTGAAIITSLAEGFVEMPVMKVEKTGYGAGTKDLGQPNVLRVFMGDTEKLSHSSALILETNIDNMNPEIYPYVIEKLLENGAHDAFMTPIIMKKGRPAIKISVLCMEKDKEKIAQIIFEETTTLGIRIIPIEKMMLEREFNIVKTKYGDVKFKISKLNGKIMNQTPEYEDLSRTAKDNKIPLKKVYDEIKQLIDSKK